MRGKSASIPLLCFIFALIAASACSRSSGTYGEIESRNAVESTVRAKYGDFFAAVKALDEAGAKGGVDSVLIRRTASRTDRVIADARSFPKTVESRLALDALSYAARDLARSPGFARANVAGFWAGALLQPMLFIGNEFCRRGDDNPATRMQLVKALGRGVGDKATTDIYLQLLPIIGAAPDSTIMRAADADSLVFKHLHDLILYGRSLQPVPPPNWMLTGAWFLALDIPGFFPDFFGIVPVLDGRETYLTVCFFEPGEVYERVFRDPAPARDVEKEAWIARADAVMKTLSFDDARADSVRTSGLETYTAHYFFDDYLVYTGIDSVRKEFIITLKRPRIVEGPKSIGEDSIRVVFSLPKIKKPDGRVTVLELTRYQGETVAGNRRIPAKTGAGRAFLMPLGEHSSAMQRKLAQATMPKISVGTQ